MEKKSGKGSPSGGVPGKVLKEAIGKKVSVETKTGETYRGILIDAEENLSCQISDVKVTLPSRKVKKLENVYLRGRRIRLIILPDMLQKGVIFEPPGLQYGRGRGANSSLFRSISARGHASNRYGGKSSSSYRY